MRPWSIHQKNLLRHLAAARFFLPIELAHGDFPRSESEYQMFLHQGEFQLALEWAEGLGDDNRGHAEESLFWEELLLASRLLGLPEHGARYQSYLSGLASDQGST